MATGSAQTQRQARWQDILDRQTKSGLSAAAFCKSAGIAPQTFYWWRARLRSGTPPAARTKGDTMAPFVDLGALRGVETAFDIRLELPGGVVLTIARS